ncbi:hypothetical protein RFI_06997 [Reticulomyxa filosa]|uniref:Uncharacterized protein n=1 Tax=Reticulomyxa filosa TaxID=46433 RepID=X6NVS1_RETFI|nr:hypothetical protein RFI_06997 [Reticulomyxa filosa]|eukprot:ETO30121.1 hypothetical protein RFI_06997 [Reticulomyxa filosa]
MKCWYIHFCFKNFLEISNFFFLMKDYLIRCKGNTMSKKGTNDSSSFGCRKKNFNDLISNNQKTAKTNDQLSKQTLPTTNDEPHHPNKTKTRKQNPSNVKLSNPCLAQDIPKSLVAYQQHIDDSFFFLAVLCLLTYASQQDLKKWTTTFFKVGLKHTPKKKTSIRLEEHSKTKKLNFFDFGRSNNWIQCIQFLFLSFFVVEVTLMTVRETMCTAKNMTYKKKKKLFEKWKNK